MRPEVYLVYGCPCSGKGEYIEEVVEPGDLIVSIDRIREALTGKGPYDPAKGINTLVFGVRDYLFESVKIRRGRWNNAYIVGGFPLVSERERLCKALGARQIYVESTREECIARLHASPYGRDMGVWEAYIDQWWSRFAPDEGMNAPLAASKSE